MDISGLSSSSASSGIPSTTAKNPATALSQFKAQQSGQLLSLLPSPASTPGLGLSLDIYAAVGMQSQGYLSGGLMSIELANISLGIDMSKSSKVSDPSDGSDASDANAPEASGAGAADAGTSAGTAAATGHTNTVLNDILKADGYVAPTENAYSVQTDFFAKKDSGLGGLIDSQG